MDQIIEKHKDLVEKAIYSIYGPIAFKARITGKNIIPLNEWDDLFNAGVIGLAQAAERYDSNNKASFSTFAYLRVRGAVIDYIRKNDFISTGERKKVTKFAKVCRKLSQEKQRRITAEDVAEELGKSTEKLICYEAFFEEDNRYKYMSEKTRIKTIEFAAERLVTIETVLPDPKWERAFKEVDQKDFDVFIRGIMNELPVKQRLVIYLHYFRNKKLREIAKIFGISESRVSQIDKKGLKAMKEKISVEFDNEPHYALM